MFYIADLHTHSHYAKATSKWLCLETLYQWALIKGIDVVGTGDFTHPVWLKELEEKLQPEGNGFYTLKCLPEIDVLPDLKMPQKKVLFCLSAEVSCEYEESGRLYKNHHLLYAPDFETAHRLNSKLAKYADLSHDGRPTLPIPAYRLLSIVLETSPNCYFVPAHVWTPWFSVLGSMNGHENIEACFKDLTSELFAAETSLSGDPLMCRRYSGLDKLTLLSNSDAHSAHKLGREVNLLDAELSYQGLFGAIKSRHGFLGTYEYYPQRGKYFNDGHRNCNISIDAETKHTGICPVCHRPLTIGVASRVEQLADRTKAEARKQVQPFKYVLPLPEIFSEIMGYSEDSQKVKKAYAKAISALGNEFEILHKIPVENLQQYNYQLSIAIERLRNNTKQFTAGYDGLPGRIYFFNENELRSAKPIQASLF